MISYKEPRDANGQYIVQRISAWSVVGSTESAGNKMATVRSTGDGAQRCGTARMRLSRRWMYWMVGGRLGEAGGMH